ncbi:MAG: M48 family metalloprotease [Planctomycetes bacterium]|nr:M48 family metalloprotease [Planctomycetota bacterium]
MPILLVFALVAACLPIDWPKPPLDPHYEVALALTGGSVALVLAVACVLRTWVIRTLRRDPTRRLEVAHTYGRWRRILFFVNLSAAAACVLGFGWGWLVRTALEVPWNGRFEVAPFAEFAVPLPYFVILVGCWLIYYDAERALHRALHGARPFSPRAAYLLHNLRQFLLMVMLPVTLVVGQQTLNRFAPETTRTDVYRIASLAVVPVLLLFMPLLMKPLLGLKTMPAGPTRDRLEALAKRLNFRCADFLLWPTHGTSANAMIAGLLPRVRYVIFTDRILEEFPPDELDAVFGHEVGHAKHMHIWLYAAFLALSLSVLAALLLFLEQTVRAAAGSHPDEWAPVQGHADGLKMWVLLTPVALVAVYLFVVFGALSRRCERQADVYGCKAVSCGDPACTGHDGETVFPAGGNCLCPTGIRTCARALDRVQDLNGLNREEHGPPSLGQMLRSAYAWFRHWQHGPIPHRVAYLLTLIDRPALEPRFQRAVFAFKCALMLALAAALVALGEAVGWKDLLDAM